MTTPTLVATDPTTEMPLAAPPDVPPEPDPPRMGWFQRLGRETGYVVVTFPVAIAAFVVVVTGISVGAGLLITLIGFPILTITGYAARGFAHFERAQIRDVLDRDAPSPRYRRARSDDSIIRRIFVPLGDPQTWLDLVHGLVGFVTSIVAFVVVVTWWACTLGGLSFPIWGWALPSGNQDRDLPQMLGFGSDYGVKVAFYMAIGVICAIALPFVVRAMAAVRWAPARALLSGRAEVQQQVVSLEEGRDAARAAEATSLRRLERDIHDGPQQRLVRLSMDLGRARKQAADASPALLDTLDGALAQTRDTLDELRTLSRGIAPPILADRGLRAALEELAARSTVPVAISVEVPDERLAAHVETTAYFVVSEALTNVAKHSGAHHALVSVDLAGDSVRIRVTDDGRGGAHLSKGKGLVGLGDRVRAADGVLQVTSPDGGPTVVDRGDPVRIVIADDSVLLREGLQLLLAEAGHDVVAAVGDGPTFVTAALEERPDCSIVDVRMPPSHTDEGLRAAVQVRTEWPDAKVMVLSQYVELSYADELFASGDGGVGYLLKDRVSDVDDFLESIERVASGGSVLDPQVVAQLMGRRRAVDPVGQLTPRERDVLGLMAEGRSNASIAAELVVSEGAVEKHTQRIFAKLGLVPDDAQHRRVLAVLTYLRA